MPDRFFAAIIILIATTIFGLLVKINGFSNSYKLSSAHADLWVGPDGKKKYAKTIYEIEGRRKPRHLIKSFYVYSDSAQKWFTRGILITLFQVFISVVISATRNTLINQIPDGEQIFILIQITLLVGFTFWLYLCFNKFLTENNRKRELDIHVNNVSETSN